ncbi:MAG: radical SAM protein [Methanothrix sp.]|jgi:hypothetical protein|nr:radical SAM protein [Methanothrix sp.]
MKINSISIVPQDVGCNYKCKYCIAHMTKNIRDTVRKPGISLPKLERCLKYSKDLGAGTAIVTSSGEPLLGSWTNIENILWLTKKYFGQIDFHTNASLILEEPEFGRNFSQMIAPYITNMTITVADYNGDRNKNLVGQHIEYKKLFNLLNNLGIVIRLSCVVCIDGISSYDKMIEYLNIYKEIGVSQVVFRELWIPINCDPIVSEWCTNNYIPQIEINKWLKRLNEENGCKSLSFWGDQPYDYNGIGVATSTCTKNNNSESIKSVVYRPDNNLYPDWDSKVKIM